MKRLIFVAASLLILGLSMLIGGCSQKAPEGIILAEYNDKFVMADELDKEVSELPEWKQDQYKDQAGREEYLTLMAESRMLLQVAFEKGLDRDLEIVKQTKEYRDQLMVKELVKREVDDQIKITDDDLKKYYEEHKSEYVEPERVVVTEITMKEEAKAKEVMEKIKAGADTGVSFTELAKEMDAKGESSGPGQGNAGKTRPFSRDSYSSAKIFVEAAFGLEVGAMSDIIVQPLGDETYYMIIRLDERVPSRQQEFSEVESSVRNSVERDRKPERMDKWLTTLKVEHKFQLYPDRIPKPAQPEAPRNGGGEETKADETKVEQEKPAEPALEKI